MQIARIGTSPIHAAPFEAGPTAEILMGERPDGTGRVAVAHVTIPPGGAMPEHDHGEAEAVVIPRAGRLLLAGGDRPEVLEPGAVAVIDVGERVSLVNEAAEPATLIAVFAPPGFVRTLEAWPAAVGA